jgi:RNA polymerase sigma factor (sigma-70 family)
VLPDAHPSVPPGTDPYTAEALERYRPALHAFLLRSLRKHPNDIADLTQEVFARFLRDRERGRVIRNPLAYMHGIAVHIVADIHRESHQRVTFDSELAEQTVEDATFEQTDDMARCLGMRKDIIEALAKLPTAHRTLLLLVEVDGLSCKEAARATGYAVQTVKQYVSIAREQMLTLLRDYWSKETPRK